MDVNFSNNTLKIKPRDMEFEYKCIWKVIDKQDKVLFEGKFGECERYMKNRSLEDKKDVKLEPFHTKIN